MITLECNYSKKIGLPGYSSHQFAITLRTELVDAAQVKAESARLYKLLQDGVDTSIQQVGFLPANGNGNGGGTGNGNGHSNGSGHRNGQQQQQDNWNCSDKQKELITKIVNEHKLDKQNVEKLAQDRFGKSVKALNKLEASGLIEELLEQTGQAKSGGRGRFQRTAR